MRTRFLPLHRLCGVLVFALGFGLACKDTSSLLELDDQGIRELDECPEPLKATPMTIVRRGHDQFDNPGVHNDYAAIVPLPTPSTKNVNKQAAGDIVKDPRRLEQLYHDAMAGDGRAIWLACLADVEARNYGRQTARLVMSVKCQTIYSCSFDFKKLIFSEDTTSGLRLRRLLGESFEETSYMLGLEQEIVLRALELLVGLKIASGILVRRSPIRPSRPGGVPGGQTGKTGKGKTAATAKEPGAWVKTHESMSERARAYQQRVTGRSADFSYEVNGVKFDGYRDGILLEAKGPGYATFVENGEFVEYFTGQKGLVAQAKHQLEAARGHPIEWHVAEKDFVVALRRLFDTNGCQAIKIKHKP